MNKSIFITGCDTDIGKTFVSIGLCRQIARRGINVGYFKPFQSGAYEAEGRLCAPDIDEIEKQVSIESRYSYLFKGEVSPYLASFLSEVEVDIEKVKKDLDDFSSSKDFVVIEGAGGLYCPAYKGKLFADVVKELKSEIIIVTTPDLGRINHTLMTIDCALQKGIKIKGIIINKMPNNPTLSQKNFIDELRAFSKQDILGVVPDSSEGEVQKAFFEIADKILG